MIELKFLTTDSDEVELAKHYWSLGDDGKFTYSVSSLLPFRTAKTSGQLTAILRSVVVVTDWNQRCPRCDEPAVISARSSFQPRLGKTRYLCTNCKAADELAKRSAKEAQAHALTQQLASLTSRKLSLRTDFGTLPDDVALLLLAIDRAIAPRLADDTFSEKDCQFIAPYGVGAFIAKLTKYGALIVRPDLSPPNTFELDDGQLSYYPSKAVYQLTTPSCDVSRERAIVNLRQRQFIESHDLAELWLDLATAECMRYLHDQAELHNLPIDFELAQQTSSAIRVAAEIYSVAELWNVIWKVVRDAATLSRRDYYNPTKAAATLPGKIKRQLEKEKKGEVTLKPWSRPDHQPSGTLGELFVEIFAIDEETAGSNALKILSPPITPVTTQVAHGTLAEREQANRLFEAACGHDAALEVLDALAGAIANGFSTSEAIDYVYEALPLLHEPY